MSVKSVARVVVAVLVVSLLPSISERVNAATTVTFNDFSNTAGLTINGNAATATTGDGVVLRVTRADFSQAGSAFSTTTINAATFSTFFQFRITSPGGVPFDGNIDPGADGIVFVVQSVANNVGSAGQGIGYQGINKSVGVEFDTWNNSFNNDPGSNHVGININGSVNHADPGAVTVVEPIRFDDLNVWSVWVDYDGVNVQVRFNQTGIRPTLPQLVRPLDIVAILGQTTAFVGFTSGTGADFGNHDILRWQYNDVFDPIPGTPGTAAVPEPASLTLWTLSALGCAIGAYRRRQRA